jgi:hypothetical protein
MTAEIPTTETFGWPWSCSSPREMGRQDMRPEIDRLRAWLTAIGNLADVDADERGWMVRDALAGKAAPDVG